MFMYVLTFVACIVSNPGSGHVMHSGQLAQPVRCESIEIPWHGTLEQCMLFGQMPAAQWVSEHPGWGVVATRSQPLQCTNARAA